MSEKLTQLILMKFMWNLCKPDLCGHKYPVSLNAYTIYQIIRSDQEPLNLIYYYYMHLMTGNTI